MPALESSFLCHADPTATVATHRQGIDASAGASARSWSKNNPTESFWWVSRAGWRWWCRAVRPLKEDCLPGPCGRNRKGVVQIQHARGGARACWSGPAGAIAAPSARGHFRPLQAPPGLSRPLPTPPTPPGHTNFLHNHAEPPAMVFEKIVSKHVRCAKQAARGTTARVRAAVRLPASASGERPLLCPLAMVRDAAKLCRHGTIASRPARPLSALPPPRAKASPVDHRQLSTARRLPTWPPCNLVGSRCPRAAGCSAPLLPVFVADDTALAHGPCSGRAGGTGETSTERIAKRVPQSIPLFDLFSQFGGAGGEALVT